MKEKKGKSVAKLAEELGLSSKALKEILKSIGYQVKSIRSQIDEEMERKVREKLEEDKKKEEESVKRKMEILGLKPQKEERKRCG
jgi:lambda repressor-like predicted transcriptional regulator